MDKILEKIKDIMYDSFDYIVMLGIVVVVVAIIGWRLDVLFTKQVDADVAKDPVVVDERPRQDENDNGKNGEEPTVNPTEKPTESPEETPEEPTENPAEQPTDPEPPQNPSGEEVSIIIPAGSLPGKIGLILQENGLIDSSKSFIAKVVEMNMDTKLKSGTFKIAKGSSYEEILNILTK